MARPAHYSRLQIALHWGVALLVAALWFTQDGMGRALHQRIEGTGSGTPLHVWLGLALFAVIALRIVVRLTRGAPAVEGSYTMQMAAELGHRLLYVLMLLVPALGALAWFGGVEVAADVHEPAALPLVIVALGHAAVALWHQYVRRDGTLLRMLRPKA
jgi:cytochrome b561